VIRSVFTLLVALVVTPPLALLAAIAPLLRLRPTVCDWITRAWLNSLTRATGVPVRADGLHNLPADRPALLVSNHQSWFDVGAIALVLDRPYRFVAKKELTKVPLWGPAWTRCGHIAVDRTDTQAAIESLARAAEFMRRDNSAVIMFPEGTRSPDGELLPFKKGAFRLATQLGVDVVPVAVVGSRDALPRGGWRIRRSPITVRFGQPIPAAEFGALRTDELMSRVRTDIERLRRAPVHYTTEEDAGDHEHSRA
jgi:1-acyl-sn-glycerol-3-phosphate acyltransferase